MRLAGDAFVANDLAAAVNYAELALDVGHAPPWHVEDLAEITRILREGASPRSRDALQEAQELGYALEQETRAASDAAIGEDLPHVGTSFVGRQAELDAILGALATEHMRLLTLHGPGGAGKSRLSLEAARLAAGSGLGADGVHFVPLETVTDAEAVPGAIASSLHVILAPDRPPSDQMIQVIGARSMLLVLDNAEHLVDSAPFLASLLRQCPNVRLLVTSRVRLGLAEEHVMNIYGLDLGLDRAEKSDAIDLLHERMKQHGSLSQLTYDVTGAEFEVCQLLRGAPLAIELAAALTRAMLRGSGTPSSTSTRSSRSDTTCWALRR